MATKSKTKSTKSTKAAAKSKPAAKSTKAESNGAAAKSKPAAELDKWGSPLGSSNATVNAFLAKANGPKTFAEIVKGTGLTNKQVRYAHLNELVAKKLAKKEDLGWVLIKK